MPRSGPERRRAPRARRESAASSTITNPPGASAVVEARRGRPRPRPHRAPATDAQERDLARSARRRRVASSGPWRKRTRSSSRSKRSKPSRTRLRSARNPATPVRGKIGAASPARARTGSGRPPTPAGRRARGRRGRRAGRWRRRPGRCRTRRGRRGPRPRGTASRQRSRWSSWVRPMAVYGRNDARRRPRRGPLGPSRLRSSPPVARSGRGGRGRAPRWARACGPG